MKDHKDFCTCNEFNCPNHPRNHDLGCSLCIQKNLREKEIPACFFHDIDHPKPTKNYHYEDFAALVTVAKAEGKL